jgi:polar amino acid transport system substrate-binding protein
MMKQFITAMCLILTIVTAQVGFATDAPTNLLIVRPDGSWPPWEMVVDGELAGVHIELVQEIARKLNLSVTIKSYPWNRAIRMLEDGKVDAGTYMSKTKEREQFSYFYEGNILSRSPIGFFTLKKYENAVHFSGNLKSLQSYIIGACRGFSYGEEFDQATYLIKDAGAEDEKALLRKMDAGRFKIAIGYINDITYSAKELGISEQLVFLHPQLSEEHAVYLAFSKARQHEQLAKEFSDAMKAFKATPQYHELLKKYGVE